MSVPVFSENFVEKGKTICKNNFLKVRPLMTMLTLVYGLTWWWKPTMTTLTTGLTGGFADDTVVTGDVKLTLKHTSSPFSLHVFSKIYHA